MAKQESVARVKDTNLRKSNILDTKIYVQSENSIGYELILFLQIIIFKNYK